MIFAGETEVIGENLPSATLSTTNPTWIDPGLRGERPATNRLSHGTAYVTSKNYKQNSNFKTNYSMQRHATRRMSEV
jgi:hypothetical protein